MLTNRREIKLVLTKALKPTMVLEALFYFKIIEESEIVSHATKKKIVIKM